MEEQEMNQTDAGETPTVRRGGRRKRLTCEAEPLYESKSRDGVEGYVGFVEQKYTEERRYLFAMESPDIRAALHEFERSLAVRDSISRRLCGGSGAVTVAELGAAEQALVDAKTALAHLVNHNPILLRNPLIASATVTG